MARARVEKLYGNHTGRRFAAVILPDGRRVDVIVRGPKDGSSGNAWGDLYPSEETRRPQIYAKAAELAGAKVNPAFDGSKRQQMGRKQTIELLRHNLILAEQHPRAFGAVEIRRWREMLAKLEGVKDNPPLVVLGNPGKSRGSQILSRNIVAIRYQHEADGEYYEHKFKRGSVIELLPDGSIRVFNPRGVKLWGDY